MTSCIVIVILQIHFMQIADTAIITSFPASFLEDSLIIERSLILILQ